MEPNTRRSICANNHYSCAEISGSMPNICIIWPMGVFLNLLPPIWLPSRRWFVDLKAAWRNQSGIGARAAATTNNIVWRACQVNTIKIRPPIITMVGWFCLIWRAWGMCSKKKRMAKIIIKALTIPVSKVFIDKILLVVSILGLLDARWKIFMIVFRGEEERKKEEHLIWCNETYVVSANKARLTMR